MQTDIIIRLCNAIAGELCVLYVFMLFYYVPSILFVTHFGRVPCENLMPFGTMVIFLEVCVV